MTVADAFREFDANLTIDNRDDIASRYRSITEALNGDFWGSTSRTQHRLYFGSYGRGTAIRGITDLDMIFELPGSLYGRYDRYKGNGQSALLQHVRRSLRVTYRTTTIGADRQVVVVLFPDKMNFEVLPAFAVAGGRYVHPDAKEGGSWKEIDPRSEMQAIRKCNHDTKSALTRLCRMTRAWQVRRKVSISAFLIDTLAYGFLTQRPRLTMDIANCDVMVTAFFHFLMSQDRAQMFWYAPGSDERVYRKEVFETKAKEAHVLALKALEYAWQGMEKDARRTWAAIYGKFFPILQRSSHHTLGVAD